MKNLISKSPSWIKRPIKYIYGLVPYEKRLGKVFWDTYNFLQESQWWSKEQLQEYQMRQLEKLLNHAYENVPYYRRVFDERGLKPKDIRDFDDLKRLPYLTKDIFRENFNTQEIISKNSNLLKLSKSHTSGTTGKPLQFYLNKDTEVKEWAFVCHQWSRVGYKPGDKRVEIRGTINKENPIYHSITDNFIRLSPIVENKEKAKLYLNEIEKFGAVFLHGYPGAIANFAFLIKEYSLDINFTLKAVLLASENVYEWERDIIEKVFNCRAFSFYGSAERIILAAECEKTTTYHCVPQYGIVEVEPETKEIIATGFMNNINPFIRYRMTDIARNPKNNICNRCCRCYYPIFEDIEGRLEDFILSPEGYIIAPAIITHPFKDLKTIRNTQIIQTKNDEILLFVVPLNGINHCLLEKEIQFLSLSLKNIISGDIKIISKIVDYIPLSSSGKFKWIDSKISKSFFR